MTGGHTTSRRPGLRQQAADANLLRRHLRGATMVWFMLFTLPLLLFSAALAIDVSRILIHDRQMTTVAEAAALAASQQYQPQTARLNTTYAHNQAEQLVHHAFAHDVTAPGVGQTNQAPITTFDDLDGDGAPDQVTVEVPYRIDHLQLLAVLSVFTGTETTDGSMSATATSTAFICDPTNFDGATNGLCERPRL